MQVARDAGLDERVRAALARGSSRRCPIRQREPAQHGSGVDVEPPHPKMGPLVKEASLRCHANPGATGPGGGRGRRRAGFGPGAGHGPSGP